jgi:hypothetical protein
MGRDVSIVIVSWNARAHLEACLKSIQRAAAGLSVETIVVDNGSADGSPELVRERFPWVRLTETGANLGFSKGNNVGIAQAEGRYLCLVNSDVVVLDGCLPSLVAFMDRESRVGLAGPRLLNSDGSLQASCRYFPTIWNHLGRLIGVNRSLAHPACRATEPSEVDVLAGAFWLARATAVDQVGVLDERFFIYGEDLDWCKRFREAGWRTVYFPEAKAIHHGGASSSVEPARFSRELQYASLQLWRKHYGTWANACYLASTFLSSASRAAIYAMAARFASPGQRDEWVTKRSMHWQTVRWLASGCPAPRRLLAGPDE